MLRTIAIVERSLQDSKIPAVTVPDKAATDVLADSSKSSDEIAYIELFNVGPNATYYAIGRDCDDQTNLNGAIPVNSAVSIISRERVSCYSVGGCKIGITAYKRLDFSNAGGAPIV